MPATKLTKSSPTARLSESPILGETTEALCGDIRRHFNFTLGRDKNCKSAHYAYTALALAVRDRLMECWRNTQYAYESADSRKTYYLGSSWRSWSRVNRTRASAMAVSGGWLHVSSTVVPRCSCR
jgi:hypothetical protein